MRNKIISTFVVVVAVITSGIIAVVLADDSQFVQSSGIVNASNLTQGTTAQTDTQINIVKNRERWKEMIYRISNYVVIETTDSLNSNSYSLNKEFKNEILENNILKEDEISLLETLIGPYANYTQLAQRTWYFDPSIKDPEILKRRDEEYKDNETNLANAENTLNGLIDKSSAKLQERNAEDVFFDWVNNYIDKIEQNQ